MKFREMAEAKGNRRAFSKDRVQEDKRVAELCVRGGGSVIETTCYDYSVYVIRNGAIREYFSQV